MAKAKQRRKRRETRRERALEQRGQAPGAAAAGEGEAAAEGQGAGRAQASSAAPKRRRAPRAEGERPPPPWGSFPLVEIAVLIGIVLIVWGFIAGDRQGGVMIVAGLGMASLAGIELAVREHFGGFRSHTALLAGAAAVLTLLGLSALELLAPEARVGATIAVFALAAFGLARWFKARTGRAIKIR